MELHTRQRLDQVLRVAAAATHAPWAIIRLDNAPLLSHGAAPPAWREGAPDQARAEILSRFGHRLGWIEVGGRAPAALLRDLAALAARAWEGEGETERTLQPPNARMILSTVQAIAVQTGRRTGSIEAFLAQFLGRLRALTSAEDLLSSSRQRGGNVADLAAAALGALAPGQSRWQGPDVELDEKGAASLAAAFQELAINALRHGALSQESGRVEVMWRMRTDGGFSLEWLESGGPAVALPSHRGYGLGLLEGQIPSALNGDVQLNFAPGGLRAHFEVGAVRVVRRPAPAPAPVQAPAAAAPQPAAADLNVRGRRILVVEDSILLAMELEAGLAEAGAEVVGVAAEVDEALAMIGEPIDAAVLDANLNGRSVAPVAAALSELGVPFVFATGYAESAEPLGFDAPIVRKPYNVSQVVAALAQAAKRKAAA